MHIVPSYDQFLTIANEVITPQIYILTTKLLGSMAVLEGSPAPMNNPIALNVGFYDPFSIFQGGFRSDFEKHIKIPSFYWKDNYDYLRVLKNVDFKFHEEIPHSKNTDVSYLRFMFISCQTVDDYRAKVRPLVLQWLNGMKKIEPKIPYFIFFFENTELRTAADKYLKTNLFNKLKLDFDNKEFDVDNIFKIKSMYPSAEDKTEVWRSISASVKHLLSKSINSQLLSYNDDVIKTANIFENLNQDQDALACYSKLFNSFPFIKKEDFESVALKEIEDIFNPITGLSSIPGSESKFLLKCLYFKRQELILLTPHLTDVVYIKNICRLSQTLISFLNSLEMCYKRNEISYLLIDLFLKDPHFLELLQKNKTSNYELINNIGNLQLLQRNELLALGTSKNYYIKGSMSIIDVQFLHTSYEIMDQNLISILSSKKVFVMKIIELTRDIISLYDTVQININTVASLSTELALILYYSTDDYDASYDQLLKSYDFFFSNGWKYIGITLLEVYIENLDKLIEVRGLDAITHLLSSYVTLATNQSSKFDENSFKSLCSRLERQTSLKTNDLLKIHHISSVYCTDVDVYKLSIRFRSKIISKINKLKLSLRNKNNETVQFTADDVQINDNNCITLYCRKINFDTFKTTNISLIIGKFELIQPVNMSVHITPINSFYDLTANKMKHNTNISMRIPCVRYLHSDRLLFETKIGSNPITDVKLIFMKTDPDKLVPDVPYQMICVKANTEHGTEDSSDVSFEMEETSKKLTFIVTEPSQFEVGSCILLYIPYFFPPDISNTILGLSYSISFTSLDNNNDKIPCSQKCFSEVESSLPIAVAADETFRSSYTNVGDNDSPKPSFSLFSQYTVNSVSADNPIRIQNVMLNSENSTIETWKSPSNIVAFVDQGSTFFYKISNFTNTNVLLTISYNSIRSEIISLLNMKFIEHLETSENTITVKNHDFFLFISVAKKIWDGLQYKLNFYALIGKIYLIDFDAQFIDGFLKYIDRTNRSIFRDTVLNFVNNLPEMKIDEELKSVVLSEIKQELSIIVNLPPINVINVVEYHFEKVLQYLVCEPINVKVILDVHMLGYNEDQIEEFDTTSSSERKVHFSSNDENSLPKIIDLDLNFTDYDQKWIISGIKNLEAKVNVKDTIKNNGSRFEFNLTFIPLKPGKLQLPGIEIKNQSEKTLIMELDYKNTAESILVVSELNKIIHSF